MAKRNSFNIQNKMFLVLKQFPNQRLTSRQIAQHILTMFPDECAQKKSRASVDFIRYTFEDQLAAELGSTWRNVIEKHPQLETVEKRPREYYYSENSEESEVAKPIIHDENNASQKLTEHDLYPKLGEFVFAEFDCYAMRLDELKSRNTRGPKGNMWLYPDIVGMVDLTNGWSNETVALAKARGAERSSLYSFEVKLKINRANVRECFFQTLSNSAWAHNSYLAAGEINSKAMPELRLLCASHGVGLIQIDVDDPTNSQILIPAKQKSDIDWNLLNRLADENKDAKIFVKTVRDFHLTGETSKRHWDLVPR